MKKIESVKDDLENREFCFLYDALAKSILRANETRELVAGALSYVTSFPKKDIVEAEFVGGELPKDNIKQKGQVADIIIHLDKRRCIVIEINKKYSKKLINKNGYYATGVALGKRTKKIPEPKVWLVNIDNFVMKPCKNIPQYFEVLESEYGKPREFRGYRSVHLPIAQIIETGYNDCKELYLLAKILNAKTLSEVKEICSEEEGKYMEVYNKIEKLVRDPILLGYYDYEEAQEQEKEWLIEEARGEGMLDGLQQGLERGRNEGIEDGQKILIKKMSKKGLSAEEISTYTDLSTQQINSFLNA